MLDCAWRLGAIILVPDDCTLHVEQRLWVSFQQLKRYPATVRQIHSFESGSRAVAVAWEQPLRIEQLERMLKRWD